MRKITLSALLSLMSFTMLFAQFPEGFETSVPPAGWATFIGVNGEGTNSNWTTTITAANGSQAAYVAWEDVPTEAEDWLVTPQFTPTAAANILTFQQRQQFGTDYGSVYTVRVSTASQTNHADFTIVDTQTEADFGGVYSARNVDLSAYNGIPIYVAFVMTNNDGDSWSIDDVDLIADANPPTCASNPTPADGATDVDVTGGAVVIAWDAPTTGDPATSYEVFWGTTSGDLTSLGSLSNTTVNITGIQFSTTYYWSIVPSNVGGSATGCAEWSFTTEAAPPPPANDVPSGAIALSLDEGSSCGANTLVGVSNGQTTDSGVTAPSCGSYAASAGNGDLWYTVTAPSSGQITFNVENVTGLTSVAGAFYSGTVGALVEEDCTEFSSGWPWTVANLTPGTTYYLRVWDFGNDQLGSFDLCGYFVSCTSAEVTTEVVFDCDNDRFNINVNFSSLGDAVSVSDGTNTFVIDVDIAVAGPYAFGTDVDLTVVHSDTACDFTLATITAAACPPANDACEDATAVLSIPFNDSVDATASSNNNGPIADCGGGMNDGVWYSFTPSASGTIDIVVDNVAGWDPELALYSGSCGAFTCVDSVDSGLTGDGESLLAVPVDAGVTYFINVGHWSGSSNGSEGPFSIDISGSAVLSNSEFKSLDFSYYPNPTDGKVQFETLDTVDRITVFNMLGQQVLSAQPKAVSPEFDMTALQPGAYFLRVVSGGVEKTVRVIRN
jgi:hypothetical protein